MRTHFWPFTEVFRKIWRFVTRKVQKLANHGSHGCHECVRKRLNPMGAPRTHTEDTAHQGRQCATQSLALAQGEELASSSPQRFQLALRFTGAAPGWDAAVDSAEVSASE